MINRLMLLKTALVLAATLALFVSRTQASWHWYYLRIQQHHAMAYHYQQQVQQHHMNVYASQVHHLNQIRQQIQNHVHTTEISHPTIHAQQRLQHYRTTAIQRIPPRHLINHEMEHERKETHYVLRSHYVPPRGRCFYFCRPWEIYVRTVRENVKKAETHRTIHQPPRHTTTAYHRLVKELKKHHSPPPRQEHVARQEKTAAKVQNHQERVAVVRKSEKTEVRHGTKEWDTYLLLKVYYWTNDAHPRTLPKPRPDLPRTVAKAPPGLPVPLPLNRPGLQRSLPQPGPHPIDKMIQRQRQAPPLALPLPKPARLAPERFALTAPKMPSPLPVAIPVVQPARKPLPEIVPVRMMLLTEDLTREPDDVPPLFPAVFERAKPAEQKPEKRAKEKLRVGKAEPRKGPAEPGLFLPAMRDAGPDADVPQRQREPSAASSQDRYALLLPGLRPPAGREREADDTSVTPVRVANAVALQREREGTADSPAQSWHGFALLDDGDALAPLFPPAAASVLRLPAEG